VRKRYEINASKSATVAFVPSKIASNQLLEEEGNCILDGDMIPVQGADTHLGLQRDSSNSSQSTIDNNLGVARKTLYALMGSGLHGKNRLHPGIALKTLETYVTP
jgi:hypothetical protein